MTRKRVGILFNCPIYTDDQLAEGKWHIEPSIFILDMQARDKIVHLAKEIVAAAFDDEGKAVAPNEFAWAALESLKALKAELDNLEGKR